MRLTELIENFEQSANLSRTASLTKSDTYFYDLMVNYLKRVEKANRVGGPLVWHSVFSPVEIFYAMDIVPLATEFYGLLASIYRGCIEYLRASSEFGTPVEACSAQRIMIGLAVEKLLPPADLVVGTSQVCDSSSKSFEIISHIYQTPAFLIDSPYRYDEEGTAYYLKELEKLIQFLESHTGKTLDLSRLQRVVELSEQATDLLRQINKLRMASPSPAQNMDFFNYGMIIRMLAGTEEAVKYLTLVRDELQERIENRGEGLRDERYRLLWLHAPPMFSMDILDWMEKQYGAKIVMDQLSICPQERMNHLDPLRSLAGKGFNQLSARQFNGPADKAVKEVVQLAQEYGVVGAVFFAHIGCKQGCGIIRLMKDALHQGLNIYTLVIDGDLLDPSVSSPEVIKNKLEGFFEVLEEHHRA